MGVDNFGLKLTDIKEMVISIVALSIILVWIVTYSAHISSLYLIRFVLVMVFGYLALVFDIKTKRIPNKLILAMLSAWVLTIAASLFIISFEMALQFLFDSLLGFVIGGGLFLLVYLISKKGLGGGDVKFMAVAGLYLGFADTIAVMLYGTVIAAVLGIALILAKKIKRKDSFPLAPFLFIGIMIVAFFGGVQG